MIKKKFCRMNIYLRKIYVLFVTQTFSVWKNISQIRYIFFTCSYIFFSPKTVFFSKKIFNINPFFYIKSFFSANHAYFVKNTNIFSKHKIFFFSLVLQQLNNHSRPNINLDVFLKFTKRHKAPGITLKKHGFFWRELAVCKWFSCCSGWNKGWYASVYKEMELEMDCLTSRIPLRKASSYKYQFCTNSVCLQGWSVKFKWWLGKI